MGVIFITLKYSFKELFKGKVPVAKKLFEQLEDLQTQIEKKSQPKAIVKKDVKLTKTGLKKAFGDPKEFDSIGIVFNTEGNYIIVSDGLKFNFTTLEEV